MAVQFAPVAVGIPQVTAFNTIRPASIVGSGDVWGDIDPDPEFDVSTYTETWRSARSTGASGDDPHATIEPVAVSESASRVWLDATWAATTMVDLNGTGGLYVVQFERTLYTSTEPAIYVTLPGDVPFDDPVDVLTYTAVNPSTESGATTEFRDYFTGDLASPGLVRSVFAEGCSVRFRRLTVDGTPLPYDVGIRVHGFAIEHLAWETPTNVAPPCRRHPRSDKLSNSPRRHPPPKSRQYGNRATGYL